MWEVDPETKSKLLAIQKRPGNSICCDCGAPSPQWASPKFGNFICLTCAGLHRGLGVHISFVRSITMDAFKGNEMKRMELGGNEAWKSFWEEKEGKKWADVSLEDRYSGDTGEEWKERLSANVEGREFRAMPTKKKMENKVVTPSGFGGETPVRTASPAGASTGRSRKEANESFFARKGNENASRSADLPPSQGGKYAGFGSEPAPAAGVAQKGGVLPGVDEFQKDPVAAITKGFGWFTTTVGKGAKTVNDGWIQPTAQKIAEADLATQARLTAAQVAQKVQTGSKGAAEQFNKFVEDSGSGKGPKGASRSTAEPERKDFWDSFGGSGSEQQGISNKMSSGGKPSVIGTAAMKKGVKDKGGDDDKWEEF